MLDRRADRSPGAKKAVIPLPKLRALLPETIWRRNAARALSRPFATKVEGCRAARTGFAQFLAAVWAHRAFSSRRPGSAAFAPPPPFRAIRRVRNRLVPC